MDQNTVKERDDGLDGLERRLGSLHARTRSVPSTHLAQQHTRAHHLCRQRTEGEREPERVGGEDEDERERVTEHGRRPGTAPHFSGARALFVRAKQPISRVMNAASHSKEGPAIGDISGSGVGSDGQSGRQQGEITSSTTHMTRAGKQGWTS